VVTRRAAAVLLLLGAGVMAEGPAPPPTEYEVKAAFLYNFGKFVEWPPEPDAPGGPFIITVLGRDPFGGVLDETLRGKTVAGREVTLRRVSSADRVEPSQILFISDSERQRLPEIIEGLGTKAVLTVGEMSDFSERGGVIGFLVEGDRIRLEINLGAAQRSGLRISSDLLRIARVVGGGG
jgi:hypothetical protein